MVLTEWVRSDGYYFVTLYSKADGSLRTGRSASLMVDGQPMPIFMNVATNDPFVMASVLTPMTILSIMESPDTPNSMKKVFEKLVEGKDKEQIEAMNPIVRLLHIKKH
jgi:hypothetical protein